MDTSLPIVVTPLRPREPHPLLAVHAGLSPRSRLLRYHAPTPRLTASMLRRLTDLRPGQHEAYAAWHGHRALGIVRWTRVGHDQAELAVEVVDSEHCRGVGRQLVRHATRSAHRAGIRRLVVDVHADNRPVRAWLHRMGAEPHPSEPGRYVVPTWGEQR